MTSREVRREPRDLRFALSRDVIDIGAMRDPETMEAVLREAETGNRADDVQDGSATFAGPDGNPVDSGLVIIGYVSAHTIFPPSSTGYSTDPSYQGGNYAGPAGPLLGLSPISK
jgi:hypothetical protein